MDMAIMETGTDKKLKEVFSKCTIQKKLLINILASLLLTFSILMTKKEPNINFILHEI